MAYLFAPRPMDEVKQELLRRAKENRNPFLYTIFDEVAPVINGLRSVDREEWARAFGALAAPHEERAARAEANGDVATARREYLIAYDCYHAARYFDPPLERVEMPFNGKAGEGAHSIGLLRKTKDKAKTAIWAAAIPKP